MTLRIGTGRLERGSALVEFALSFVIVVFLIFWIVEMSMLVYTYAVLSDAAKEGVRYAIVHGSGNSSPSGPGNVGNVKDVVINYAKLSFHDVSAITVMPTYPDGTNNTPGRVNVTVTYNYLPYINFLGMKPVITVKAQGRIVN